MEKQPNEEGWSISSEEQNGLWHLVHNGENVILFILSEGQTSTTERLFVGTKEECEVEIARLGLPILQSEPNLEPVPE